MIRSLRNVGVMNYSEAFLGRFAFILQYISDVNVEAFCIFYIYFPSILTNQAMWCIISMENAENICNNDR